MPPMSSTRKSSSSSSIHSTEDEAALSMLGLRRAVTVDRAHSSRHNHHQQPHADAHDNQLDRVMHMTAKETDSICSHSKQSYPTLITAETTTTAKTGEGESSLQSLQQQKSCEEATATQTGTATASETIGSSLLSDSASSSNDNPEPSGGSQGHRIMFPEKLHQILANPHFSRYIHWAPHGKAWRILDRRALEIEVLPLFFKHAKSKSFMKQVNLWNFDRIKKAGPDYGFYTHELFRRDQPELCRGMIRRLAKSTAIPAVIGGAGSGSTAPTAAAIVPNVTSAKSSTPPQVVQQQQQNATTVFSSPTAASANGNYLRRVSMVSSTATHTSSNASAASIASSVGSVSSPAVYHNGVVGDSHIHAHAHASCPAPTTLTPNTVPASSVGGVVNVNHVNAIPARGAGTTGVPMVTHNATSPSSSGVPSLHHHPRASAWRHFIADQSNNCNNPPLQQQPPAVLLSSCSSSASSTAALSGCDNNNNGATNVVPPCSYNGHTGIRQLQHRATVVRCSAPHHPPPPPHRISSSTTTGSHATTYTIATLEDLKRIQELRRQEEVEIYSQLTASNHHHATACTAVTSNHHHHLNQHACTTTSNNAPIVRHTQRQSLHHHYEVLPGADVVYVNHAPHHHHHCGSISSRGRFGGVLQEYSRPSPAPVQGCPVNTSSSTCQYDYDYPLQQQRAYASEY
mmetsp:Transcript_9958/g.14826  ORF Transcript_9958/g.14826 Transcript_9958/m.14826 type:complete len:685 (-) Transcript_9958:112-2166(-)